MCCTVLSAVLWLLRARSLGPLPSQQHQTKRSYVAVRSLNSKLTSFLFLLFQKLSHLLVTKHWDFPGPVLKLIPPEIFQVQGGDGTPKWFISTCNLPNKVQDGDVQTARQKYSSVDRNSPAGGTTLLISKHKTANQSSRLKAAT